jgi:hypothetical protein
VPSQGLRCEYLGERKKRRNDLNEDRARPASIQEQSSGEEQPIIRQVSDTNLRPSLSTFYFLDRAAFERARLSYQGIVLPIDRDVVEKVGTPSDIHATAEQYFQKVHFWMPIISKAKFYSHLLHPLSQRHIELSLLVLCMRLICSSSAALQGSIYRMARRLYSDTVSAGVLSIEILQAGILMALYEVGHALYPAAYFSVGMCARHGAALDLDKAISHSAVLHLSWSEIEERRRVWWSILILDRSVILRLALVMQAEHHLPFRKILHLNRRREFSHSRL